MTGSAGKSRVIRSPSFSAVSVPDRVSKEIGTPGFSLPFSQSTNAEASVAWPQSSTSFTGVNHRRFQPPETGREMQSLNASSRWRPAASMCYRQVPEDTDRGGIPAKGGSGKGIDQVQLCMHGKGICMRVPIKEWDTGNVSDVKILVRPEHLRDQ